MGSIGIKTGGKKKGYKAPHTLLIQEGRKALINKYLLSQDDVDDALIAKAKSGDIPAIRELYNRVFGMSIQAIEMTGKDGKDLFEPSKKVKELAHDLLHRQRDS